MTRPGSRSKRFSGPDPDALSSWSGGPLLSWETRWSNWLRRATTAGSCKLTLLGLLSPPPPWTTGGTWGCCCCCSCSPPPPASCLCCCSLSCSLVMFLWKSPPGPTGPKALTGCWPWWPFLLDLTYAHNYTWPQSTPLLLTTLQSNTKHQTQSVILANLMIIHAHILITTVKNR